jgi:iron complex transport system ATP-binding protein
MNIIDLQNITVFQGRNKVLDNISLTIDESQSTVILGPNGSGKTTLLKLLIENFTSLKTQGAVLRFLKKTSGMLTT